MVYYYYCQYYYCYRYYDLLFSEYFSLFCIIFWPFFLIVEWSLQSNKILTGIKQLMHNASKKLGCWHTLVYVDQSSNMQTQCGIRQLKAKSNAIELILSKPIRFIANLKGRDNNISAARKQLKLKSLKVGKKSLPVFTPQDMSD